jgi:hypothetical protein
MNGGRRPIVSDRRENIGWKAVEVKRKEVESHEAELDALKYEVIAGWLDAIRVLSKHATLISSVL